MKNRLTEILGIFLIALITSIALVANPPIVYAASDQGFSGVTDKTASYTCTAAESGTIFTNRGASGAVIFTLPAVGLNLHYRFVGVADQTFTVTATAGTIVSFNDAGVNSVACSTSGQKIGAVIEVWSDGTSWFVEGSTVGVTYTIQTAS